MEYIIRIIANTIIVGFCFFHFPDVRAVFCASFSGLLIILALYFFDIDKREKLKKEKKR